MVLLRSVDSLTLLSNKRQRPCEYIHKIGQPVWVRCAVELPDVHDVVLVFEDGGLVIVNVEVVRRTEDGHDTGETSGPCFPIHSVSSILCLVRTNDREQVVLFEEGTCGGVREEVRAATDVIVDEEVVCLFLTKLFERIGPQDVAHEAMCGWLAETVDLEKSVPPMVVCVLPRTLFRSSSVWSSGLSPPCIHKNCLFMTAARGSAQKASMQAS